MQIDNINGLVFKRDIAIRQKSFNVVEIMLSHLLFGNGNSIGTGIKGIHFPLHADFLCSRDCVESWSASEIKYYIS